MRLESTRLGIVVGLVVFAGSLFFSAGVLGQNAPSFAPYPQPDSGYVTDLADLLTAAEEERIEKWLWQTEATTDVEIVVVTIDSISDFPGTANTSIEAFATGLFNQYKIGNTKNDGVLLVVAKQDRKARIELGARYGHARDGDATKIMQGVIVPSFKTGDFDDGITCGVKSTAGEFAGVRIGFPWTLVGVFAAAAMFSAIAVSLFRRGKRGWGWVCVGAVTVLLLAGFRMLKFVHDSMPSGGSDSWGSGGFGGSGGGGFGGGSSGGGGATGGW